MENKINIAEILKSKPRGTKLNSPIFGDITFDGAEKDLGKYTIFVTDKSQVQHSFMEDGRYTDYGVPLLFPSKEMRDWWKFTWKKGDVLQSSDGRKEVIFDSFVTSDYTCFKGKHFLDCTYESNHEYKEEIQLFTASYNIEEDDAAKCYINAIEKKLGGKLNPQTLEVEKAKEFQEGDILYTVNNDKKERVFVLGEYGIKDMLYSFIILELSSNKLYMGYRTTFRIKNLSILRLATEEEKQQLFDALAKEGKQWNADTKQVEDIKPKWTPKSFERVLVRDSYEDVWRAGFFSHISQEGNEEPLYVCVGQSYWQCLPYNEETAKLLGTTDSYTED